MGCTEAEAQQKIIATLSTRVRELTDEMVSIKASLKTFKTQVASDMKQVVTEIKRITPRG